MPPLGSYVLKVAPVPMPDRIIDRHIGNNLRTCRRSASYSATAMAAKVGVSQQQYRKYEQGETKITCSRVYEFAKILNVTVASFFEGLPPTVVNSEKSPRTRKSPARLKIEHLARQPIGTLARFPFGSFTSPESVKRLIDLTGQRGWAEVSLTTTGTTVKKVAEP